MTNPTPAYLGFDCETTGLTTPDQQAGLLEIGLIAYDPNLNPLASYASIVTSDIAQQHINNGVSDFVHDMHTTNDLWSEHAAAKTSSIDYSPQAIEQRALDWMAANNIPHGLPMLGSSITFDRGMLAAEMPQLHSAFHYRSVDASTLKILATTTCGVSEEVFCANNHRSAHRVLSDIADSACWIRLALGHIADTKQAAA